jgi:hypothetical protein
VFLYFLKIESLEAGGAGKSENYRMDKLDESRTVKLRKDKQ